VPEPNNKERLQKILADAGIGSRRQCERLIAEGHVTIDGRIVIEMGIQVDPAQHEILFDGKPVRVARKDYFLLNKPKGFVSTLAQEDAGRRVIDLMKGVGRNLRMAGRLDRDTEGLIILTNDGELINLLTHPRHQVPKTYWVKVEGRLDSEDMDALRRGVFLAEGRARAAKVNVLFASSKTTVLSVVLKRGMNRQIRRMFAKLDHPVQELRRTAIDGISDQHLKAGRFRRVTSTEVDQLYRAARQPEEKRRVPAPAKERRR